MNKRELRTRLVPKIAALLAAVALSVGLTYAAEMITPVAVTAQSYYANDNRAPVTTIDGSGMNPNSPVTATSITSTTTAGGAMWLSAATVQTWITFDLGAAQTLTGFRLWNYNEEGGFRGRGVKTAGIYVGTTMPTNGAPYAAAGASWGTLVANMTFDIASGIAGDAGADYAFANTVTGRYVQVYVTANHNNTADYTGLSEIRFYADTAHSASDQFVSPTTATAGGDYVASGDERKAEAAINGSGMAPSTPVRIASTAGNSAPFNMWLHYTAWNSITNTWITFDLGTVQKVTGLRIWNYNESGASTKRGVKNASIYVGNSLPPDGTTYANAGPAWGSWIQDFRFCQADGSIALAGADYPLATPVIGDIQLYITDNFGGDSTGLSEVMFYTSTRYEAISPIDATAQSSFSPRLPVKAINGSGMMPKNPLQTASTAGTLPDDMWLSDNTTNTWITFDLGAEQSIAGLHLWNYNENSLNNETSNERGINTAGLYVGETLLANGTPYASAGAAWGTLVTNMTFAKASGLSTEAGSSYTLATPVTSRYIQLYVTSNFGGKDSYTGLSEIMFYTPMRDLTRLNSGNGVIENRAIESVRVIEGTGDARALTLGGAATVINTLYVAATEAPVNVDLTGQTLALAKIQLQCNAGGLTMGSGSESGTLKSVGTGLLVDNPSTYPVTINSVIANGSGASSLTKTGRGALILTGANTFSGNTAINGGTLRLAGGSINSPALNLNMGAEGFLSFDGGTITARSGASALDWIGAGNILLIDDSGATIDTANASVAINRPLLQEGSSAGGLTKTGANTLTLTAPCTYIGATKVQGGILKLAPPAPLIHYSFDTTHISGTTVQNLGIGGTAYNGVIHGVPATGGTGVAGQSVTFAATGQGIVTAGSVSLPNGFTFAAWVKSSGSTILDQRIINNDFKSGGFLGTSDHNRFKPIIKNHINYASTQASDDTANWHHIAMSWDGSIAILYYDGVAIQTNMIAGINAALGSKIGFGNNIVPNHEFWNGSMDEAYVFDRTLTAAEVAALKNQSLANMAPLPITTDLRLNNNATLELDGVTQTVTTLTLNGVLKARGDCTWGAVGSGAGYTSPQFVGTGMLRVLGPPAQGTIIVIQ